MSANHKQLDQYRRQSVEGASPLRLVLLLYDSALRHLNGCKTAMRERDHFRQNEHAQRAQGAIGELLASLDLESGGEVAGNLAGLYAYAYKKCVVANLEDDDKALDECIEMLSELRQSWAELESGVGPQEDKEVA